MKEAYRKAEAVSSEAETGMLKKLYSVGIYARLSVDNDERKHESVETQLEIAKAFIGRQNDMTLYDSYIDIGKTGTNFEREGFARMMRDVRMRRIDCIVVKDLSRFGRNHIETGNYIEKIFPFMGVRFIAVTDNFDSINIAGGDEMLGINLKNLVNEMYARDIAMKIKSGKRAGWEQGSYMGGIPPYGYKAAWIEGKKCLLIEDTTSEIVKKMFDLFLSGSNMNQIVLWLYENKILRPSEYRKTGRIYCRDGEAPEQWSRETVKMILTNPVYTGSLVRERTCAKERMMCDTHAAAPQSCWVREHTHAPVISETLFFEAAERFEKSSVCRNQKPDSEANAFSANFISEVNAPCEAKNSEEDIFADVLYCGDCGSKMKRITAVKQCSTKDKIRIYSYNCRNAGRIDKKRCPGKGITLCSLNVIIKKAIRQEFSLSAMRPKELVERNNREAESLKEEWHRRLVMLDRKREGIARLGSEQYLRYRTGAMDEEHFRQAKEENDKRTACIQGQRAAIEGRLRETDLLIARKNRFLRALVKGDEECPLSADAVRTLIDRIEVYPDCRVRVSFAFKRYKARQ